MVTFIIGKDPDQENFMVHKEHACRYSPVLDKAFNSTFKEGETQNYTMDDASVEAFRMFVQWIYSQKLNVSVHNEGTWMTVWELQDDPSNHVRAITFTTEMTPNQPILQIMAVAALRCPRH
jgi:hypothetical protein